jgi:hypothetical protein
MNTCAQPRGPWSEQDPGLSNNETARLGRPGGRIGHCGRSSPIVAGKQPAIEVSVGSGTVRAHQHAAGARKDPEAQKEPPGGRAPPSPPITPWDGPAAG